MEVNNNTEFTMQAVPRRIELRVGPEVPAQHTMKALHIAMVYETTPNPTHTPFYLDFEINQVACIYDGQTVKFAPGIGISPDDKDSEYVNELIQIYNDVIAKFKAFKDQIKSM